MKSDPSHCANECQKEPHPHPSGPPARRGIFLADVIATMRADFRLLINMLAAIRAWHFVRIHVGIVRLIDVFIELSHAAPLLR